MTKSLANILLGEDMEGGEVFCDEVYNSLKNHWRADYAGDPCAVLTEQLGMVISDGHDDHLYHITTGPVCTEIVQGDIPLSNDLAIIFGTDSDGSIRYEETTNDALIFGIPVSPKRGVIICDQADVAVNFGGIITAHAQPVFWFVDLDNNSYLGVGHQADDRPGIWSGPGATKLLAIQYEANADVTFFENSGEGENRYVYIYGWDAGAVAKRYGRHYVHTDGRYHIDAEEAPICFDEELLVPITSSAVSDPPTDAELNVIWTSPATVGIGWWTYLQNTVSGTILYLIVSDGSNWWYETLTAAI